MMTPRDAITRNQVWLRPFGHFCPADQGYMGFSSDTSRDRFFSSMEDGAIVVIWTRQKNGERGWVGKFRGLLQMTKIKGPAHRFSSAIGSTLLAKSDADFSHAVQVVRAWEADPLNKVPMELIIPSMWPKATRDIGRYSKQMYTAELRNIEGLSIREVPVFNQASPSSVSLEVIRKCFV